jgi:hypothetical protein
VTALLGFAGDLFLGARPIPHIFGGLQARLGLNAKLVINFEGTLYQDVAQLSPTRRKILLTSPIEALAGIEELDTVLYSVGHNHIADYGNDVAQFTLDSLNRLSPAFGAGFSADQFHLSSACIDGVAVGFAAYCTLEASPLFSTPTRIGPRELSMDSMERDLAKLRTTNQLAVALVHWGGLYTHYPTDYQLVYGRQLIDSGFDLVVGTHPHAVQGYAQYRGRYIFYSLGNFFFPDYRASVAGQHYDSRWMARCNWSIVPLFHVTPNGFQLETIRFVVRRGTQGPLEVVEDANLLRQLRRFSRAVSVKEPELVCARHRAVESTFWIPYGEFSVKDRKLRVLARKAWRAVGLTRV